MLKVVHCEADKAITSCFDTLAQEVLTRGSCIRFKAHGQSMHPFIRNGDIILIEPKRTAEFNIGDIIFYRRPWGNYIVHRLIRKNSPMALITKGDNLHYYDQPVPVEQALGKVIAIERDGRYLKLDSGLNEVVSRAWARLSPMSRWLRPILRPGWKLYRRFSPAGLQELFELCLTGIQGISVYRRVGRSLRSGIEIKEANEEEIRQVLHWLNPDHSEHTVVPESIKATYFVAKSGGRVIGYVDLVRRSEQYYPHDGYWLSSLKVRTLSRGTGIGEELARMVMEKSKKEGAKELSLLVQEHNHRAIKLYQKLDFKMRVIPTLERQLEDERRSLGYRRICMFVHLG